MLFQYKKSLYRMVDENLKISDLFSKKSKNFDFVIAKLSGSHPVIINQVSERIYFILEGNASVLVEDEILSVGKYDLVYIRKNQKHSIKGDALYVILTSPPFDPKNETIVG